MKALMVILILPTTVMVMVMISKHVMKLILVVTVIVKLILNVYLKKKIRKIQCFILNVSIGFMANI